MKVLMIGGTGFIGSAIARRLAAQGHVLTLPTRRRERAKHLTTLPTASVVEADVHDPAVLTRLMRGQDAVISLVGILRGNFMRAHAELPAKIAAAAKAAGVRRIVHISALGAAPDAASAYQRSKAAGEAALRDSGLDVTVLRPSVVFGAGDSFMTLFAGLQALFPVLPLACPQARMQPVWVEDVARVATLCLERAERVGQTYELGGPTIYTLRELVEYAGAVSGHRALVIGLPGPLAWLQAFSMEIIGGPMTRDNLLSLRTPNVCASASALPFALEATALEAIAPAYLGRAQRTVKNDRRRESARR
jgi:NADH dehydrogenase